MALPEMGAAAQQMYEDWRSPAKVGRKTADAAIPVARAVALVDGALVVEPKHYAEALHYVANGGLEQNARILRHNLARIEAILEALA